MDQALTEAIASKDFFGAGECLKAILFSAEKQRALTPQALEAIVAAIQPHIYLLDLELVAMFYGFYVTHLAPADAAALLERDERSFQLNASARLIVAALKLYVAAVRGDHAVEQTLLELVYEDASFESCTFAQVKALEALLLLAKDEGRHDHVYDVFCDMLRYSQPAAPFVTILQRHQLDALAAAFLSEANRGDLLRAAFFLHERYVAYFAGEHGRPDFFAGALDPAETAFVVQLMANIVAGDHKAVRDALRGAALFRESSALQGLFGAEDVVCAMIGEAEKSHLVDFLFASSLAKRAAFPYDSIAEHLGLASDLQLERLCIAVMEDGMVKGRLDTNARTFEIKSILPRNMTAGNFRIFSQRLVEIANRAIFCRELLEDNWNA